MSIESKRLQTINNDSMLKRLFDATTASLGLIFLSPLLLLIGLAIKWHDGGPIFYRANRVGKDEQLFGLYKFRSMVVNADKQGPGITTNGDNRITSIGRLLRRTKLDELPQLLNVLKGEISLVGPRPEDPRYVALYTPQQRQILRVRPGITSAACLRYRHEEELLEGEDWENTYRSQVMPAKLAIDLAYLEQRTFWTDLDLITRTVLAMFK